MGRRGTPTAKTTRPRVGAEAHPSADDSRRDCGCGTAAALAVTDGRVRFCRYAAVLKSKGSHRCASVATRPHQVIDSACRRNSALPPHWVAAHKAPGQGIRTWSSWNPVWVDDSLSGAVPRGRPWVWLLGTPGEASYGPSGGQRSSSAPWVLTTRRQEPSLAAARGCGCLETPDTCPAAGATPPRRRPWVWRLGGGPAKSPP